MTDKPKGPAALAGEIPALTPENAGGEDERIVVLRLEVFVPADVSVETVAHAINAALDEPPCDWGVWTVAAAVPV